MVAKKHKNPAAQTTIPLMGGETAPLQEIAQHSEQLDEAIARYRQAIVGEPNSVEAHIYLGSALRDRGQLDEAISCYEKVIALQANIPVAHYNLGNALHDRGKIEEAIAHYQQAITLKPNYLEAYFNQGVALKELGKLPEAIACYRYAIALQPKDPNLHLHLGLALLLSGDLKNGFAEYEWRFSAAEAAPTGGENTLGRSFSQPLWDGSDLQGRTILLYAEQGFGDAIQFIRYAPLVAQRGGRVLVACYEPLLRLFATVAGIDRLASSVSALPEFDVRAPLMSLPHILGTTLENIPADIPYLGISEGLINNRKENALPTAQFKVGIVWAGKPLYKDIQRHRSCAIAHFLKLLDSPGVAFYSLQTGPRAADLDKIENPNLVKDLAGEFHDFADTAAAIAQLDLVITVDTSVAHLAGALGKPVWVLLPFAPDWRWMLERSDSPWYPTMRLFRQSQPGDWEGVFDRVQAALAEAVAPTSVMTKSGKEMTHDSEIEALHRLGAIAYQKGDVEEAIARYQQVLTLKPDYVKGHNNIAIVLKKQGKLSEAIAHYKQAIAIEPNSIEIYNNLGNALMENGQLAEAIACFQTLVKLIPDSAEAYYLLGNAFFQQKQTEEAIACFQKAIQIKPDFAEAYYSMGNALRSPEKLDEAIAYYEQAIALKPNFASARTNLGMLLLLAGDFRRGLAEYEWRFARQENPPRPFPQPLWDGSELHGRTILLYAEQGFGDTIQFIRYAPLVAQRGGRVIFECPKTLLRLFATIAGIDRLVPAGAVLPDFDVRAPLMSLPYLLGTTLETIPANIPYIGNSEGLIGKIGNRKENSLAIPQFKVGIVWCGSPTHPNNKNRSCQPSHFQKLLEIPKVVLYSLQKGVKSLNPPLDQLNIQDLSGELNDFADTAAAIAQLDLVITIDTSVAHLAGAMGCPVWLLLSFDPDWRWMLKRSDTPWYPTMRLFRQSQPGDWDGVFDRVQAALRQQVAQLGEKTGGVSPSRQDSKQAIAIAIEHHQAGRLTEAEQMYRQILQQQTDGGDILNNLAIVLKQQGQFDEAIACYQQAITLAPNSFTAYYNLGNLFYERKQLGEAIAQYRQAIALQPEDAQIHYNLGNALQNHGQLAEAIAHYRQAIALRPNYPDAYLNLANALQDPDKIGEAIAYLNQALTLQPNYIQAHINLGNYLKAQGKLDAAIASYQTAVRLQPDCAEAHCNLGIALLRTGDLRRGFAEFEWRWKMKNNPPRPFSQPLWDGSNLDGRTLLLHGEQGFGDTIQFIRYVSLVRSRGGTCIIVECYEPLIRLLSSCPDIDRLVPKGAALPEFHVHAPLMSLPHILGTTLETIPADIPYLSNERSLIENTKNKLFSISPESLTFPPLKVGIVWAGSPNHLKDRHRSCKLAHFLKLVNIPGVALYSLQKGNEELKELKEKNKQIKIYDLAGELHDFADTAAAIAQLDLVISVDTSVAHLSGALGKPVWILLHYDPDWRWMQDRDDSPWYPTLRLFRQSQPDRWEPVFERVEAALRQKLAESPLRTDEEISPLPDSGLRSDSSRAIAIARQHYQAGELTQAEQIYRQFLQQQPNHLDALNNLGVVLKQQGKFQEAIACYERVLTVNPKSPDALYNLGNALRKQGRLDDAIAYYQKAVALRPNCAEFHNNLGLALFDRRQLKEAIACYKQAIALQPNFAEAYNNIGNALYPQGYVKEAIAEYEKALQLKPNHADFHKNLSHALLRVGDLRRGFAEYEWRWQQQDNPARAFSQPFWDGSDLEGRTILLHAEQGFGDTIQFIRYVPLVRSRGGRVIVECYEPLIRLLSTCPGIDRPVALGAPLPEFHVHAPLMSLPHILGTTLETIPADIPYLGNGESVRGYSKDKSLPITPFKVGIVWAGNPEHPKDGDRSCQLSHFELLLDIPGVAFYSLQKGLPAADLAQSKCETIITDLGFQLHDFADTAAAIAQLDLVITIDTSVAHLTGALGKPVWVLLHFDPDWRWMLKRSDTPWYPTMRLFRQNQPGDWEGVFEQVKAALSQQTQDSEAINRVSTINENSEKEIAKLRQIIRLQPNYAEAYYNLGNELKQQEKFEEAIANYQKAIALKQNYKKAHFNLANTLLELCKIEEAIAHYQQVITLAPDDADAHTNLGFSLILAGHLTDGFAEYEWRQRRQESSTFSFPQPVWDGSNLQGRTILLHAEEGFGDTIQFIRYAPLVQQRGGRAIALVPQPLVRLLSSTAGIDRVVPIGATLPDFQVHASLMSLPHILGTTLETIPADIPYLGNGEGRIGNKKENSLPIITPFKVGIVWAGSPRYGNQRNRSCKLAHFLKLLDIPKIVFYSLQKGPQAAELRDSGSEALVQDLASQLNDFADTAAAIDRLDLVITVDTSVAHLAGAMGKPVWVLLPFAPDCRWMLEREDSPWYPTMRLFRQSQPGDWEGAFHRVYSTLKDLAESRSLMNVKGESPNVQQGETMIEQYLSQVAAPEISGETIPETLKPRSLRIGLGWSLSMMTGWGVIGMNLTLQLLRSQAFQPVLLAQPETSGIVNPLHQTLLRPAFQGYQNLKQLMANNPGKSIWCDFPVLHALFNNFLGTEALKRIPGKQNVGMIVFENTQFTPQELASAQAYDTIVTGSSWSVGILKSYGVSSFRGVPHGIDPTIFHPAPKSNLLANRFVIFSGGKLEYRKGQDIVVAAFKAFRARHAEALLLTAWHNFWPQFMLGLDRTGNVVGVPQVGSDRRLQVSAWLVANGLPPDSFIDIGPIPNHIVGEIIREADAAVFPNRCEGGTNLVAMETMACGIPTILSANTGHLDLIGEEWCYPLRSQRPAQPTPHFPGVKDWGESDVEEIVETLEKIYTDREEAKKRGGAAAVFMKEWTWENQVYRFLKHLNNIV